MIQVFILFLIFNIEVLSLGPYKIENRIEYSPGYVCNYEERRIGYPSVLIWTCVHESRCKGGGNRKHDFLRDPELEVDNCGSAFLPPSEGGKYVCCHPEDDEDINDGTVTALNETQFKYAPGFRSAFKCNDYKALACLNTTFCSFYGNRRESKGGTETNIQKYTHLALIGWYNADSASQSWFCLGSVISERFILTAAACKKDDDDNLVTHVRVGENKLCFLKIDCRKGRRFAQTYRVEKLISHPAFDERYYYHDIMLLKLERDIKWNRQVRPACMFFDMDAAVSSGGMFAEYEDVSDTGDGLTEKSIHEMEIQTISQQFCSRDYSSDPHLPGQVIDEEIMVCGGLPYHNRVPCTGDYGGPLQVEEENMYCIWQVYGVMVYSDAVKCHGKKPAIFTRVPSYLNWLEGVVWADFNLLKDHDTSSAICIDALAIGSNLVDGRCRN